MREEVRKDAARVMSEDLTIGERAVDGGAHGAQVSLPDFRIDRRTGELAIGKLNTGSFRSHNHFLQEFGSIWWPRPREPQ
jgi:hypothetical protein